MLIIPGDVTSKVDWDVDVTAELAIALKILKQLGIFSTCRLAYDMNDWSMRVPLIATCMRAVIFVSSEYVIRASYHV